MLTRHTSIISRRREGIFSEHQVIKLSPTMRGSIWMLTGFVVCPCHLPVTLPLILGLFAGTAFGVFLTNNSWIIGAISLLYFLGAVALGFRSLFPNANAPKRGEQ